MRRDAPFRHAVTDTTDLHSTVFSNLSSKINSACQTCGPHWTIMHSQAKDLWKIMLWCTGFRGFWCFVVWRILLCCINVISVVLLTAKALKIMLMKDHHQSWCNTQWIQSISGRVKSQMTLSQRIYEETAWLLYFKSAAQKVNQENQECLLLGFTIWAYCIVDAQCNYFSDISKNTDSRIFQIC